LSLLLFVTALAAVPVVLRKGGPEELSNSEEEEASEETETEEAAQLIDAIFEESQNEQSSQTNLPESKAQPPQSERKTPSQPTLIGGRHDPVERDRPTSGVHNMQSADWALDSGAQQLTESEERARAQAKEAAFQSRQLAERASEMTSSHQESGLRSSSRRGGIDGLSRVVKPTHKDPQEEEPDTSAMLNARQAAEGRLSDDLYRRYELGNVATSAPLIQQQSFHGDTLQLSALEHERATQDYRRLEELFVDFVVPTPERSDSLKPLQQREFNSPFRQFNQLFGVRESYLDYASLTRAYLLMEPEGWWDQLEALEQARPLTEEENEEPALSAEAEAAQRLLAEEALDEKASESWSRLLEPAYDFNTARLYRREESKEEGAKPFPHSARTGRSP
ncbi:MAG: hypothetical protein VYD19_08955, partial [Myxococcota bacterium]|nr:hypothetical protein [Myxococcota bacterium]